jgi:hypothetical protein
MSEDVTKTPPNMLWQLTDDILLCVGGNQEPTDREFAEYYEYCEKRWPPHLSCTLVVTGDAGLNAKQRDAINKLIKTRKVPPKVAIVTDSTMVRGVVTALSWFNSGTKAFPTGKLHEALAYLGVQGGGNIAKVVLEVRKMQTAVTPPKRKAAST